jgi:hypothetical protein
MTPDDRDSVNATVEHLGLLGALKYAQKRLATETDPRIRKLMILIARETLKRLTVEVRCARRLIAQRVKELKELDCHAKRSVRPLRQARARR